MHIYIIIYIYTDCIHLYCMIYCTMNPVLSFQALPRSVFFLTQALGAGPAWACPVFDQPESKWRPGGHVKELCLIIGQNYVYIYIYM